MKILRKFCNLAESAILNVSLVLPVVTTAAAIVRRKPTWRLNDHEVFVRKHHDKEKIL